MRKVFLAVVFGSSLVLGACQSGNQGADETDMKKERDSFSNSVLDKANQMFDSTKPATDTAKEDSSLTR